VCSATLEVGWFAVGGGLPLMAEGVVSELLREFGGINRF
jgi:hypothetical protein